MSMSARLHLALLAVLFTGAPAAAQTPSDAAKAMVGTWEMSNADRDRTCTINLKVAPVGTNYALEPEKKCGDAFPPMRAITAWTFGRNDSLLLLDSGGRTVLELLEVEAGMYEGLRPNEERYFLQNAAVAAASRERPADDMFGEWSIVRGATTKPICAITLANSAATADNFAVEVKPGCDQLITRFAPAGWRMERGQLVVQSAKGEVWRFEESDPNTWKRIPESRQPLTLLRQ
jgi:protease inhibitor Inh